MPQHPLPKPPGRGRREHCQRNVNQAEREQRRGRLRAGPDRTPVSDRARDRRPEHHRREPDRHTRARQQKHRSAHGRSAFVRMHGRIRARGAEEDHAAHFYETRQRQRPRHAEQNRRRNRGPGRRTARDGRVEQAEIDQPFADKAVERRQAADRRRPQARTARRSTASRATARPTGSSPACRSHATPSRPQKTAAP